MNRTLPLTNLRSSAPDDALAHSERHLGQLLEVEIDTLIRHVFAARDAVHFHLGVEFQVVEQLGRHKEVLARALAARNVDHALVHHALVARVHALIDLVDDAEWRARKLLQRHEIEDC